MENGKGITLNMFLSGCLILLIALFLIGYIENYNVTNEQLVISTVEKDAMDLYLISEDFGEDSSQWSPYQLKIIEDYLVCQEDWWSVATLEQEEKTSELTLKWLCWHWSNDG